jgi:putative ABC transport system substrate-binding protein
MKRRAFITLLGGAAAGWPLTARAQKSAVPVLGFLGSESRDSWAAQLRAFGEGLSEAGYVEGRNLAVEYRWADGRYQQLPRLAAELVDLRVAAVVANGPAVLAAKTATTAIPIVFLTGADPVRDGLVASLHRPGGNLTGVTILNVELGPKRLELLREVTPKAKTIAILINPTNPNAEALSRDLQDAATTLGLRSQVVHASAESHFDKAFATITEMRADALMIGTDPFFIGRGEQIAALSVRHRLPAIFQFREFVAAGGLMSYGGSIKDAHKLLGNYAGRVLKGEKPADLPVLQVTKVELFINLKTAKALGLAVPLPLLGRADEVIE